MTERDAFLAAIRESPDDDLPRLAFADWLDEHDEPGRAEFVRVQCRLVILGQAIATDLTQPCSPWLRELDALRKRERELWAAGTRDFDAAFPGGLAGVLREFRRGFVEAVTCPADWWLAHGDAIRRAHPVVRVTLTTWPEDDDWRRVVRVEDGLPYWKHLRWKGVRFTLLPAEYADAADLGDVYPDGPSVAPPA